MFKKILIVFVVLLIVFILWSADIYSFFTNMFGEVEDYSIDRDYSIVRQDKTSDTISNEIETYDTKVKAEPIVGKTIVVDSVEYEVNEYLSEYLEENYYTIDDNRLYDDYMKILFSSLVNYKKEIEINGLSVDMIETYVDDIFEIIIETEYMMFFEGFEWVENGNSVTAITFLYEEDVLQSYLQSKEISKQISNEIFAFDMNDIQKAKAAYDYVILNTEYSKEAATYVNSDFVPRKYASAYESYGVFFEKKAVCQGYAYAFNMLLDTQDIENRYVQSDSLNHGWSMVQIDGNWYHCDLTYDDPVPDREGVASHEFFLKNDAYMINFEPERLENIGRKSNANNYYYEIYDKEFYILNDVPYVYVLEGDAVVRYHTDVEDTIDFDSRKTVIEDVASWHDIEDDFSFLYTRKSDGDLYKINFDGRHAERLIKGLGGYIIDVESNSDELIVSIVDDINGNSSIVTID